MDLTPTEVDRLLLFLAAELARSRRRRGLLLNVPETIAVVADTVAEAARDGRSLPEAVELGTTVLRPQDVLPGVAELVTQVQVEAVFDDGSRLVTVPRPVGTGTLGDDAPGAIVTGAVPGIEPVGAEGAGAEAAAGAREVGDRVRVVVVNASPVPISVTSHFHFFEVNPRLRFDRAAAYGRRVELPPGDVVRFEPGSAREVSLVPIGGNRVVVGFAGLVDGPLDAPGAREDALRRARACGFLDTSGTGDTGDPADADGPDGDGPLLARRPVDEPSGPLPLGGQDPERAVARAMRVLRDRGLPR